MSMMETMLANMIGVTPEDLQKAMQQIKQIDFVALQTQIGSALKNLDTSLKTSEQNQVTLIAQGNKILENQGAIVAQLARIEANAPGNLPPIQSTEVPQLKLRGKRGNGGDGGDAPSGGSGPI